MTNLIKPNKNIYPSLRSAPFRPFSYLRLPLPMALHGSVGQQSPLLILNVCFLLFNLILFYFIVFSVPSNTVPSPRVYNCQYPHPSLSLTTVPPPPTPHDPFDERTRRGLASLGLLSLYNRYPRLTSLVNFTWFRTSAFHAYHSHMTSNANFTKRHVFSAEELSAPRRITKDVPAFIAENANEGFVVDVFPQAGNGPRHAMPLSRDLGRTCRAMNLVGATSHWWTCTKSPEEVAVNLPSTTHVLVTAVLNGLVDPGWCNGPVPGNVFTPRTSFYYQSWTHPHCYNVFTPLPAGFDFNNAQQIIYHPQLLNSVGIYLAAPGHFGPQQLPRVIRLLMTAPTTAKLLVAHSSVTEQLLEVLVERGFLTNERIVWYEGGLYMGGLLYQSQSWPFRGPGRQLHDRTDMRTVHFAMVDDLPENDRRFIVVVDRGKGARSIVNQDALLDLIRQALVKHALDTKLRIVLFKAEGHLRTHIDMFRRAQIVVAPHGAGLYNVFFCKPFHTAVLEIGYTTGMMLPEMYMEMATHSDLDYYLVNGAGDYGGRITVDEADADWAINDALYKINKRHTFKD